MLLLLKQVRCVLCSQIKAATDLPVRRHSACGLPYTWEGSNSRKGSRWETGICLGSPSCVAVARMELLMCIVLPSPECSQPEYEQCYSMSGYSAGVLFWEGEHKGRVMISCFPYWLSSCTLLTYVIVTVLLLQL